MKRDYDDDYDYEPWQNNMALEEHNRAMEKINERCHLRALLEGDKRCHDADVRPRKLPK